MLSFAHDRQDVTLIYRPEFTVLILILVHAADMQERDGAVDMLAAIRTRFPWLRHVFADGGYAGEKLRSALVGMGKWTTEIIKRSDKTKGFECSPPMGYRANLRMAGASPTARQRLGKVHRLIKAWALIASICMLTRRTARYCQI